jgi:ELWxxDGT repeat protein
MARFSMLLRILLGVGLGFAATGAFAGAYLVKNITWTTTAGSTPSRFTLIDNFVMLTACESTDCELWRSDGTEAGTVMVKNIHPYDSAYPEYLTKVNDTLFFAAIEPGTGRNLWKSDGTEGNTVLVKDILPGPIGSPLGHFTNVNGSLFFLANNGTNGDELWKSDGTDAGTVMVKDIVPGTGSSLPNYLTDVNGTLFFEACTGPGGALNDDCELWKSDGTEAGTVRVKDIGPGNTSPYLDNLVNVNGTLFFAAHVDTYGKELWKSDGTEAGTVMVKDINPGSGTSVPASFINANGMLFFTANNGVDGTELWKSDGTEAGTVMVKDIWPGPAGSLPLKLTAVGNAVFFVATTSANGPELWKSDGTAAGTVLVKDIVPGNGTSNPDLLVNVNGTLMFRAYDPTSGVELWKSDGTAAGTVLVKDIKPGSATSNLYLLTNIKGAMFFGADDGVHGAELWAWTRFDDVRLNHFAFDYVEAVAKAGITSGCNADNYCPDTVVNRAQMAVFLERGMKGASYVPPAATGTLFGDVGAGDFAAAFIEQLASDGITSGCGGGNYCPTTAVSRAQMAVFLLRAKHGSGYVPPASGCTTFADVPPGSFACEWIEQMVVEGITSGCGGGNYCPNTPVTRAQMAVFLQRAFNLALAE